MSLEVDGVAAGSLLSDGEMRALALFIRGSLQAPKIIRKILLYCTLHLPEERRKLAEKVIVRDKKNLNEYNLKDPKSTADVDKANICPKHFHLSQYVTPQSILYRILNRYSIFLYDIDLCQLSVSFQNVNRSLCIEVNVILSG